MGSNQIAIMGHSIYYYHNMASKLLTFIIIAIKLSSVFGQENVEISYMMREQVPYNTPIGNVIQDSNLGALYSTAVLSTFRFGLLQGGRYNNYFQISNNGDFGTEDPLNREVVCPSADLCEIFIDAAILQPAEYFTVINIKIVVQDRNDYTPTFPQPKLVINMSESTLPGAEFVIPPAIDLDSTQFGVSYYDISPPVNEFELLVSENSDGSQDLRLKLMERLDRETNSRYTMTLVVFDGGEPPKQSSMEVEVNLVDHNDNSPVFAQSVYNITVNENFSLDTTILQVYATDADTGQNGLVKYALSSQTRAAYGDLFQIDATSGAITLGEHLDYEQHKIYTIQIEASDHGVGSLPAIAKVYLNVQDYNDHTPSLTISGVSATGNIEIPEEGNPDVPVAHISVNDLDEGRSGEVECSSPNREDFILRERSQSTFMVISSRSYDYETQTSYSLPVICIDHGTPQLSTSVDIAIAIVDINDNPPIFDTRTYALRFRENNTVNAPVLQVTASDRDSGDNGRITYTLNEEARSKVRINPDTGAITALVKFDYEDIQRYIFQVSAWDNGSPVRRSDNATVVLTLIDTNDEVPVFLQPSYSFGTFENQVVGTEIGTIQARDADSSPYDEFKFSLDAHSQAMNVFTIDPDSGEITTLRMLDREHVPSYHLTVIATNTAFPRLASSVSVTVYVVDRNDNAPLIIFPNQDNNTVNIMSNMARGSILTQIIARDADLGDNKRLEFSIGRGNEEGLFMVDSLNGAMSVNSDLSDTVQSNYELLIMVKDMSEEEQKSAVATLHVNINRTVANSNHKSSGDDSSIQDRHKLVIIILTAVTIVLVIILVTAIIFIKRRQMSQQRRHAQAAYKVEVAPHHQNGSNPEPMQQKDPTPLTLEDDDMVRRTQGDHVNGDRTHLTLEDIKRMKCLYRNTPDVARHAQFAPPEPRPAQAHGNAYNVRKNAEMLGIYDLLSDGDSPLDDDSTDSNADSGRGTSETGNDVSHQKINLSDDRPSVVNRHGVITPVHMYLKDKPSVGAATNRTSDNNQSTFGAHLRPLPAMNFGNGGGDRQKSQHVTFDLSNQSPSHKQYNSSNKGRNPHPRPQAANQSKDSIHQHHHQPPHSALRQSMPLRTSSAQVPVHSSHSEVSESCDNLSLASTTSGEYFVQLDNGGPLHSVEV